MSDKIIGVSSSVKETLMSFGVLEENNCSANWKHNC